MERFRTDIRKKSIAVNGPDLWHSLSAVEKEVKSIFIFKKLLIRSFIDTSYKCLLIIYFNI